MFDIGFSELVVIGVVALVVIGPERLPKVARTAGHLFGRFQRYVSNVKADIAREMELDELRKFRSEFEDSARSIHNSIHNEVSLIDHEVSAVKNDVMQIEHGKLEENSSINHVSAEEVNVEPANSSQLELPFDNNSKTKLPSE